MLAFKLLGPLYRCGTGLGPWDWDSPRGHLPRTISRRRTAAALIALRRFVSRRPAD